MATLGNQPDDIILSVFSYCSLQMLFSIQSVDRRMRTLVAFYLTSQWYITVHQFVLHPRDFRELLARTSAILTGLPTLEFILRNTAIESLRPWSMNVNVTQSSEQEVVHYFIEVEGYTEAEGYIEDGGIAKQKLASHGLSRIRLLGRSGEDVLIRIVVSSTDSVDASIITTSHFTATMNYLSAHRICIAYPDDTLEGVAVHNPLMDWVAGGMRAYNTLSGVGFSMQEFATSGVPRPKGWRPVHGPWHPVRMRRMFGDRRGLTMSLTGLDAKAGDGLRVVRAEWTLGGPKRGVRLIDKTKLASGGPLEDEGMR